MEQVPQSRLTWPALLEHPFVRETSEDIEARVTDLCWKYVVKASIFHHF